METLSADQVTNLKSQLRNTQEASVVPETPIAEAFASADFAKIRQIVTKKNNISQEDWKILLTNKQLTPEQIFELIKIYFGNGYLFSNENHRLWLIECDLTPEQIFELIKIYFGNGYLFSDENDRRWLIECGLTPEQIFELIKIYFGKGNGFSDENNRRWLIECGLTSKQIFESIKIRFGNGKEFSEEFENTLFDLGDPALIKGYLSLYYPDFKPDF